jgi:hypothetical protein
MNVRRVAASSMVYSEDQDMVIWWNSRREVKIILKILNT